MYGATAAGTGESGKRSTDTHIWSHVFPMSPWHFLQTTLARRSDSPSSIIYLSRFPRPLPANCRNILKSAGISVFRSPNLNARLGIGSDVSRNLRRRRHQRGIRRVGNRGRESPAMFREYPCVNTKKKAKFPFLRMELEKRRQQAANDSPPFGAGFCDIFRLVLDGEVIWPAKLRARAPARTKKIPAEQ